MNNNYILRYNELTQFIEFKHRSLKHIYHSLRQLNNLVIVFERASVQPTLHDFSRKITRPVREKVTIWVAGDCRPINIVEDSRLTEVIRIASGHNSYDFPS